MSEADREFIRRPQNADVHRAMQEVSQARSAAAEHPGEAGAAVKNFCERWGTHRKAFGFARALYDMEPEKREGVIRDFLEIARKLGFMDQASLFPEDDLSGLRTADEPDAAGIAEHLDAEDGEKASGKVTPIRPKTARQGAAEAAAKGDEHMRRVGEELNAGTT
mgnify:CR=1 FL=1